jgi:hypothetical protein
VFREQDRWVGKLRDSFYIPMPRRQRGYSGVLKVCPDAYGSCLFATISLRISVRDSPRHNLGSRVAKDKGADGVCEPIYGVSRLALHFHVPSLHPDTRYRLEPVSRSEMLSLPPLLPCSAS